MGGGIFSSFCSGVHEVRGKANASAAGWIHALATSASGLQNAISSTDRDHTEEDEDGTAAAEEEEKITHAGGLRRITPTVKVAVDGINVLIQHYGEVTIAIFKAETFE